MGKKNILLFSILGILVITSLVFVIGFYIPTTKEAKFKTNVEKVVQRMLYNYKNKEGDYLLVEFPNNVKLLKGEEKEFFTKGYIIMYDRNNITFKLTDGKNCAYKDKFDKAGVITMNQKCKDYKIVKK